MAKHKIIFYLKNFITYVLCCGKKKTLLSAVKKFRSISLLASKRAKRLVRQNCELNHLIHFDLNDLDLKSWLLLATKVIVVIISLFKNSLLNSLIESLKP